MVYIPAYITKDEIQEWIEFQIPPNKRKDVHLPEVTLKMMDSFIFAELQNYGIPTEEYDALGSHDSPSDKLNLLWAASMCIALEILCMRGIIEWSTGDIALRRLGKATHQYQRWQPMFFFAQGVADQFVDLLPHQTYLMMSKAFIKRYADKDFYDEEGTFYPALPRFYQDDTSRGYGWNMTDDWVEDSDDISEEVFE